jgi:hypothetical protein
MTPTASPTASPTPSTTPNQTATFAPTATEEIQQSYTPTPPLSGGSNPVLGPVPVPPNGTLCLYPDRPISGGQWGLYNFVGEILTDLTLTGTGTNCMNLGALHIPPGLYLARVDLKYQDGTTGITWKKVVVSK